MAPMAPRNFKLTIEYDGTDFHGWQVQPQARTVQGEIIKVAKELSRGEMRVVGAGRTDAGVHAVGQVASVTLETGLKDEVLLRAFNAKLPEDIYIKELKEVPLEFNARFDARSRTYHYLFLLRKTALWRNRFYQVTFELDIPAMKKALWELLGERDFSSFASSEEASKNRRCYVMRAELIESAPILTLSITADHFLHKMVRTIAGTLIEIGRGRKLDMAGVVASRDRSLAGPTLPPHALYLIRVDY